MLKYKKIFFYRGILRNNKLASVVFLILLAGFASLYAWNAFHPQGSEAAWWNSDWDYRATIPITAHTSLENNVYVSVTIANTDTAVTAGKLQADCGDFRFINEQGNILPYFIFSGCNSATTVIHVFLNTFPAGAQTIYYYYGNPSAKNGFANADFLTEASSYTIGTLGSEEAGPGPVLYWSLDEGYGTTVSDTSSANRSGTFSPASPSWIPESQCVVGKCLYFNGSDTANNQSVIFSESSSSPQNLTGDMTISAWIKPTSNYFDTAEYIVRNGQGTDLVYSMSFSPASQNVGFNWYDGSFKAVSSNNNSVPLNQWSFIEMVRSGSNVNIYINGKLNKTGAVTTPTNPAAQFSFGRTNNGAVPQDYTGYVDELKVFNYPRSASQAQTDYNSRGSLTGAGNVMGASTQSFLSNGLVGYWKMDEASWNNDCSTDTVMDSSGNGNNGVSCPSSSGPIGGADGKFAYGGNFDGSDDYIEVANNSSLDLGTSDFTVSAWAYNTEATAFSENWLYGKGYNADADYGLFIRNTDNNYHVFSNGGDVAITPASGTEPLFNQWQHIVMTKKGSTVSVYSNGKLAGSTTVVGKSTSNPFTIGAWGATPPIKPWEGKIDETRVYNRALSPAEIEALYNWAPGPILYYNNDAGQGSTNYDASTNGYNGTLGSSPKWSQGKYGKGLQFSQTTNQQSAAAVSSAPINIMNNNTMGFWIKFTDTAAASVYTHVAGYRITSGNDRAPAAWVCPASSSTLGLYWRFGPSNLGFSCWGATGASTTFNTNQWYYVAVAKSGTTATYYVNGVAYGTATVDATMSSGNGTFYLGYNGTYQAAGMVIDEVRLYNYARTPAQIISDMNAGNPTLGSSNGAEVGHWDFDEGYGSVAHNLGLSGAAYDGALAASTMWNTNGKYNNALNITGTTNSVTVPDGSGAFDFGSGDFSVTAWVKTSSTADNRNLIHKGATSGFSGFRVGFTGGRLHALIGDTTTVVENYLAPSTRSIADNKWHQITVVFNRSGNAVGYIDGVPSGSVFDISTVTGSVDNSSALLMRANTFGTYVGMLDEVRIFNYALTAAEAKANYNSGQGIVMGAMSDTSGLTGGQVASNSASAEYCIPGDTTSCAAPVARWDFEEGQGTTVNDVSTHGNSGTWNGTPPYWGQGVKSVGKGGKFNGSDTYVRANSGTILNSATDFTIEFWLNISAQPTNFRRIMEGTGGANPRIFFAATGATGIYGRLGGDTDGWITGIGTTNLTGGWKHVAITVNSGGTQIAYVNGAVVKSTALSNYSSVTLSDLYIGSQGSGTNYFLNGSLDQIRIYDYVRTPSQVQWDYNQGGPVGYWDMDDCQGTIVGDMSGNNNNGTITAGASGTYTSVGTCATSSASSMWYNGRVGKYNASLAFDGTDDYVSVTSGLFNYTDNFSISAWINPVADANTNYSIVGSAAYSSNGRDWWLLRQRSGLSNKFAFQVLNGSQIVSNTTINASTWNHVVFTLNNGSASLYVNGKLDITSGSFGTITSGNTGLLFGKRGDNSQYLNGQVDDTRIYNYPLTASQVKMIYNQGSAVRFGPATGSP